MALVTRSILLALCMALLPVSGVFAFTGTSAASIDIAGADFTAVSGINDSGRMVGTFGDASGVHGFVNTGGTVLAADAPGALGAWV